MDNVLSLIGLAKRAGAVEAGEEPTGAAARAREARVILVARDAAENTRRRVRHFADAGQCLWLTVPFDKGELGHSVGRVSCAMLCITELGLAGAVVKKLAARDPDTYGASAEKLELKAQRAAERRDEAARHEKNLRRGVKRKKPAAEPAKERQDAAPEDRAEEPAGVPQAKPRTPHPAPHGAQRSRKPGAPGKTAPGRGAGSGGKVGGRGGKSGGRKPGGGLSARQKAAGRKRFSGSLPVKKGKGSGKKED